MRRGAGDITEGKGPPEGKIYGVLIGTSSVQKISSTTEGQEARWGI